MRRISLVTGAAGGIGRALIAELSGRGDRVIAVDLPGSGVLDLPGVTAFECDLSDEPQILTLWRTLDALGLAVGLLVNNAAMGPTMAPTTRTDLAHFRLTLRTNVNGPFLMAREAARRMPKGGAIVNTASLAGVLGNPCRNAYAASKAALISMTRSLACEWAARGIRVNAIAPGYVRTPMVAALEAEGKADLSAVRRRIPMGRLARADEMASAIGFLGSPEARYVTGAILGVDGGWMSFNQPGDAHPPADAVPAAEITRPAAPESPRRVVITGAGTGIGAAIAARFHGGGDHVVLLDRDAEAVAARAAELGEGAQAIPCDVTRDEEIADAFARIGAVDVLVNNAAIADPFTPGLEQDFAALDRTLSVNLTGAFACAQAAIPAMTAGRGVIVNLGSIAGLVPMAPRHPYGASKAGIDILTRCLAAELGPMGLRTATVAPGYIRTPGVAALEADGRVDTAQIRRRIPMGDLGRPEDIAEAVFFVASPAASYVNGTLLSVDGGWNAFGSAGDASDRA
ncbi:short-chain dehydrogenase [Pararhodobacter marinus]|uniref:Short-chain dehydrogenase n=2 Tax=Pararhodobacter marinus TaxID=2184063 RepID=A0A2U2CAU3_9RHOB|nr:SDR family oxidoreductase [Pararhodobacter marinus]PWE28961.1 short-chain dehydrogenase [Pararhodobacter marinus]